MVEKVHSLREEDFATRARDLFRDYGYRSFPVVDGDNRLAGVITRGDILNITSSRSNLKVGGLMSRPVYYTTSTEDVFKITRLMVKNNLGRIPVVRGETDMTLTGIVSAHDLIKRFLGLKPKKREIGQVMTEEVETSSPEDDITKIWGKMLETGFSGIPVVKDGEVIGIVTRMDILRSGHVRISREDSKGKVNTPPPVERIMMTPVITLHPSDTVQKAAQTMMERNIGRIPVVEGGNLVGIVDREDVLRAWL